MRLKMRVMDIKLISYHISEARTAMLKHGRKFSWREHDLLVMDACFKEVRRRLNLRGLTHMSVLLICLASMQIAEAQEIDNSKAIMAIVGEAEGEDFEGKLAVACAIRNRGTLRGVYGLNAPRVIQHKYPSYAYTEAKIAWHLSEARSLCTDLIRGAQYWEGDSFKTPGWARNMTMTAHIGHQRFFREAI